MESIEDLPKEPMKENPVTISWHWLAVTIIPITIALGVLVYKLTNAQTVSSITSLQTRVATIENGNVGRDQKIENINGNIIRICNKLNIAQCQ